MGWYKGLSRREFIKTAAAAAVVAGGTACSSNRSPWRFLRVEEARTLAAVCDCIIPADADPGAEWAQAVNYIDIQLCGYFRQFRNPYRDGIKSLESTARQQYGKTFSDLVTGEQTAILAHFEKGSAPKEVLSTEEQKAFFELVLAHTMQGYYGDPRHGGNRDRVSWKMVGLSYPQVRGRFRPNAGAKS